MRGELPQGPPKTWTVVDILMQGPLCVYDPYHVERASMVQVSMRCEPLRPAQSFEAPDGENPSAAGPTASESTTESTDA